MRLRAHKLCASRAPRAVVPAFPSESRRLILLILTRRVGETIMIGDDIRVLVQAINGNQVRLGVAAPRDIPVHREEVAERIKTERAEATTRIREAGD